MVGYKIEYYYNNSIDNSKTEVEEIAKGEIITLEELTERIEKNKAEGYRVFTVLNTPLEVSENIENNVNMFILHYKRYPLNFCMAIA